MGQCTRSNTDDGFQTAKMLDKRKRDESGSLADTLSVGFVIHICLSESQSKRVGFVRRWAKGRCR